MYKVADFYSFHSELKISTFHASPAELSSERDKFNRFDEHNLILGNYTNISFPVSFTQTMGNKIKDVLDTGWPSLYLISSVMRDEMEKNHLTGWKTYEVIVRDKKNNKLSGYYGLSITGRCGPVNYNKSEIIAKRLVPEGPICKFYKGLYVGLDQWDGKDFFLPENNFEIIISDKAYQCLKKAKLTNVAFQNLSDIETLVR